MNVTLSTEWLYLLWRILDFVRQTRIFIYNRHNGIRLNNETPRERSRILSLFRMESPGDTSNLLNYIRFMNLIIDCKSFVTLQSIILIITSQRMNLKQDEFTWGYLFGRQNLKVYLKFLMLVGPFLWRVYFWFWVVEVIDNKKISTFINMLRR